MIGLYLKRFFCNQNYSIIQFLQLQYYLRATEAAKVNLVAVVLKIARYVVRCAAYGTVVSPVRVVSCGTLRSVYSKFKI